ncbi:MAG: DUF4350 domain-containing protein [Rhizobacter sp.]|nr:DUF4350 domain-containing protein [Rhizobacter sp.]
MRWLLRVLVAALVVALAVWFQRSIEWADVPVPTPPQGEAARDNLYAAKRLAERLGATVTTMRNFEQLPPAGATLVLASRRWAMFPGREQALERWVRAGGRLVALQSAWSAEAQAPAWVPIKSSRPPRRGGAASAPPADAATPAEAAASDVLARVARLVEPPCARFAEPDAGGGAFGAPRTYGVCGWRSRVLRASAARWQIGDVDGAVALRVALGAGDVTSNAIEGSFSNRALLRDDGALAFAAMLQLAPGDRVWFLVDETRPPLLALLWQHGAPAIALALTALALALWRGGARFGPRLLDAPLARRSIGEQVRRTAAFVARGDGGALHAASVRALDDEARRSIANYAGLLSRSERAGAIAKKTGDDATAIATAMAPHPHASRRSIAAAVHRLERARRAVAAGGRRVSPRTASVDASPP